MKNEIVNTELGYCDGFTLVTFSRNFLEVCCVGDNFRVLKNGYYRFSIPSVKEARVNVSKRW